MIGALCRHTRRKPTTKRKMSSADDNLEYVPLETTASVPTSPTEVATFYPVKLYLYQKKNSQAVKKGLFTLTF